MIVNFVILILRSNDVDIFGRVKHGFNSVSSINVLTKSTIWTKRLFSVHPGPISPLRAC